MATVSLFDPRHPIDTGSRILEDVMEGRDVVADREAACQALIAAAMLLGEKWSELADVAADWTRAGGDAVVTPRVADARQEVVRVTRAAEAIFAAVLSQETGSDGGDIEAMLRSDALLEGV